MLIELLWTLHLRNACLLLLYEAQHTFVGSSLRVAELMHIAASQSDLSAGWAKKPSLLVQSEACGSPSALIVTL